MPRITPRNIGGSMSIPLAVSKATATVNGADSFSIAFWERTSATSTTGNFVAFGDYTTTGWILYRGPTASAGTLRFIVRNSGLIVPEVNNTLLPTSWNRIVLVVDGSTRTAYLYKNGALLSQSAAAAWTAGVASSALFSVGNVASPAVNAAVSSMSDICYSVGTAWALADVQADYFSGTTLPALTYRWPLDDGSGTSARETISGAVPLTLAGGAAFSSDSPMKTRSAAGTRIDASTRSVAGTRSIVT